MKSPKGFIVGLLVGILIAVPASVFAEDIEQVVDKLIGKTVTGQFPVKVDGNHIGDAIVVEGSSYLPVRSFGDSVGYNVFFDTKGEVIMTADIEKIEVIHGLAAEAAKEQGVTDDIADQVNEYNRQISKLERDIRRAKQRIEWAEDSIESDQAGIDAFYADPNNSSADESDTALPNLRSRITENQALIEHLSEEITRMESEVEDISQLAEALSEQL